jgi:hypothetical protein
MLILNYRLLTGLNRSQTGQHHLISSSKLTDAGIDIVALQEPAINFLGNMVASRDWIPLYPSTHEKDPKKTRAVILINSRIPTENWEQVDFHSSDMVIIKISADWGQIVLFNIYNDCTHNHTIHELINFHRINHRLLVGRCYSRLAVVSDLDGWWICPECQLWEC